MDKDNKREHTEKDNKREKKGWLYRWFSSLAYAFNHYSMSDDSCFDIYCY